jgi:hypothetical protein
MQVRQKQVIEAYQRVQDFVAGHPVPPPGSYGEPKAMLDEVVGRLTDHSADQLIGARFAKAEKQSEATLSKELREQHLRPISRIARAVLRGSPGIDRALHMPEPMLTTTKLIAEADAFRAAAVLYEETFVKKGRPADFIARLDAATEALRGAFRGKARNVGKKAGAKAGLKSEIVRGRDAIELLDAIVTTAFVGDAEVLAAWRSARRVRAVAGGNRTPKTGLVPTTAPAVATAGSSSPSGV